MKYFFKVCVLALILISAACNTTRQEEKKIVEKSEIKSSFEFGVWITADGKKSNEDYIKEFQNIIMLELMKF
jgi:hypothetical protein